MPHSAERDAPWSCPDCPWVHRPHPIYGWAAHDTRAIEVHRTMLCPARVTPPAEFIDGSDFIDSLPEPDQVTGA